MELTFSRLEKLQGAYNSYLLQLTAAKRAAAMYLDNTKLLLGHDDAFATITLIEKLPTAVAGLGPDEQQAFLVHSADAFLNDSLRVFLNETNWAIQTANDM